MSKTKQKRWTEQFVLKALEDNGFHPTDVKFLEGYFIFEHGEDMVLDFAGELEPRLLKKIAHYNRKWENLGINIFSSMILS